LTIKKEVVMIATGTGYIKVPFNSEYGIVSSTGGCKLIFPREGEIYDFTSHAYAWICGTPYCTVYGWSGQTNVAGKKIRITRYFSGNPDSFAQIHFEIL
jgi:hypothetical protein